MAGKRKFKLQQTEKRYKHLSEFMFPRPQNNYYCKCFWKNWPLPRVAHTDNPLKPKTRSEAIRLPFVRLRFVRLRFVRLRPSEWWALLFFPFPSGTKKSLPFIFLLLEAEGGRAGSHTLTNRVFKVRGHRKRERKIRDWLYISFLVRCKIRLPPKSEGEKIKVENKR